MNNANSPILLFDGVCNLCNYAVQFIIKRDKKARFRFASLQSDAGQELLKKFNLLVNEHESFVLITGDQFFMKSTGALKVAKILGGGWKLFYAFIILPRPIRDFFYNIIARNRYKIFGKRQECMVPTPEMTDRFLV